MTRSAVLVLYLTDRGGPQHIGSERPLRELRRGSFFVEGEFHIQSQEKGAEMFWSGLLPLFVLLVVCMAACLVCGALAVRKGYNLYIWTLAGGLPVSFLVFAFLPRVDDKSAETSRVEKTGNWIGLPLAVISTLCFLKLILYMIGKV